MKVFYPITLLSLLFLAMISCTPFGKETNSNEKSVAVDTSVAYPENKDGNGVKILALPSPIQVASALKAYNLELNPVCLEQTTEPIYASDFVRCSNLGVESVRMGAQIIFSDQKSAYQTFTRIEHLLHDLGAQGSVDKNILLRFKNNIDQKDSLYFITLEAYAAAHNHFRENKNSLAGSLVITGCFVEGLHLLTCSSGENTLYWLNLMGQQKIFLDNIIELLQPWKNEKEVADLLERLIQMKVSFNKIKLDFKNPRIKPFTISEPLSPELLETIKNNINELKQYLVEFNSGEL